jgi:glycosyltransferase involved in cell wall biosynthesis
MNIGIDARLLGTKIRGTARYLSNVIKYLPQYDKKNRYFVFQYEDIQMENNLFSYIQIKKRKLPRQIFEHFWLNFTLPKLIRKLEIDIFYTPYVFVPLRKRNWINIIVIHDALTKACKEYYTFHYRKYMDILVPLSIKRSDAIITVSKSAMQDIIKYYNVNATKIDFIYHWIEDAFRPLSLSENERESLLKKYSLPEKFILFVGVLEERKNISGIIEISDILKSKGVDIKFVLVGRPGFGYKEMQKKFSTRMDRIIHLENLSDKELILIYNLATIFLFPSHYEGFGLPVLEAMKCGLPVLTSDNSSLPEVVGYDGIIGNSKDYHFFANKIISLLNDERSYFEMKAIAIRQARKFTAEKHLLKLINIFNKFDNLKDPNQ